METSGDSAKCACDSGPTLAVLDEVHRAYEERLNFISSTSGSNKLQKQVQLLKSWVSDLVEQNKLLARTVEDLEIDLTTRLLSERRKYTENDNGKKSGDQVNELRIKIDILQKENLHKDREIKRLSKDVQQYELTVKGLKKDVSMTTYHTPDVSKKDVSVTAEICCPGTKECGDMEPVKEYGDMLRGDAQYQARLQHMESSGESVRALREVNVSLSEEVHALHRVCAALDEQGRVAALRAQFKDEIIREMRRQLRQAKAQLKECSSKNDQMQEHRSYESLCSQPRKSRDLPDLDMNPNWVCNSQYDGSGDDGSCKE